MKSAWWRSVVAAGVGIVHGALLAWLAFAIEPYFAPWLLFPLLSGLVLGASAVGLIRLADVGDRAAILMLTVAAALTAVAGQHYLGFWQARRAIQQQAQEFQKARQLAPQLVEGGLPEPAENFAEFLRWEAARGRKIGPWVARDAWAWLTWTLDGLLLLGASLALVVPAMRQPYCAQCRSWYRTTRAGSLDATAARQLARLLGRSPPEGLRSARYRLVTCRGGCGPTGFELSWNTAGKTPGPLRIWLAGDCRKQVVQMLDERLGSP